jgi:hypothetical protein
MIPKNNGGTMTHTQTNRRDSYEETNKTVVTVAAQIYDIVKTNGPISAWQIAIRLAKDVYTVRPRLTELRNLGKLKEAGSRWCEITQRTETVWDVVDHQLRLL